MLKEILTISGKPGLFKLISRTTGKNNIIVEFLADGKRIPVHSQEKVVALGDIYIFAESGEIPLSKILGQIKEQNNGEKSAINSKSPDAELLKAFAQIQPDYDRERVHKSDIKKIFSWYNILTERGLNDFSEGEEKK